jgi:hypothetical protein
VRALAVPSAQGAPGAFVGHRAPPEAGDLGERALVRGAPLERRLA